MPCGSRRHRETARFRLPDEGPHRDTSGRVSPMRTFLSDERISGLHKTFPTGAAMGDRTRDESH